MGITWYFSRDLPRVEHIFVSYRRPCIRIFDYRKNLLATYGDAYGAMVDLKNLPAYIPQALMAIEDKRFYSHFGVDVWGILRALWVNYRSGGVVQGGSTITQQLGKNILQAHKLFAPTDRSLRRKIQEVILALVLEARLTKDQIMTLYLNRVYFGAGAFGVDAAAKRYFSRSAKQLTLYESALLMGLLKAPSRYSPTQNPEKSEVRAKQVLLKMVEAGFINESAMETALLMATPAPEVMNTSSIHYFTDWVVEHTKSLVSMNQDLDIFTTLDFNLQEMAAKAVVKTMDKVGSKWRAGQMALVSMAPDGAVRAMVGGTSYAQTKFNRVTQAMRQPGSLFKFFTYLTALEKGLDPEHLIDDTPFSIDTWSPKNYRYDAQGQITLREAFAKSVNAPAIRLAILVGLGSVIETIRKLGITSTIPHNLSITLGSGEMTLLEITGAFAVILNQGFEVKPYGIRRIQNREGHVLYSWQPKVRRVVSARGVNNMLNLLQAVVLEGTGHRARLKRPTACKTGTSQNYRDLWMVGFSPELVTGVWTGDDADKPLQYSGVGSPSAHLWRDFMKAALEKRPVIPFARLPVADDVFTQVLKEGETASEALNPLESEKGSDREQAFGGWEGEASSQALENQLADLNVKGEVSAPPEAPSPDHKDFQDNIGSLLENPSSFKKEDTPDEEVDANGGQVDEEPETSEEDDAGPDDLASKEEALLEDDQSEVSEKPSLDDFREGFDE